jgi:uncharacterized membrane protein YvbJ
MVNNINEISNPAKVRANFRKYKGNDDAKLELSEKKDKKYKVIVDGKTVHFGSTMEDFTKHNDKTRQKSYLARSAGIPGNWKSNKYSANRLSRALLWQ